MRQTRFAPRLYYLAPGLREVVVAPGWGPLRVLGSYNAQIQRLSLGCLLSGKLA